MLTVHEVFYTLQGEGAHTGRPAVFCRFAGCNLWTGRERDRASAICRFCDTEFRGGEKFTPEGLGQTIATRWGEERRGRFVVLTGGEPTLQVKPRLLELLHWQGFEIAMETNGTQPIPRGVDWTTVSPKAGAPLVLGRADELKLVYPQDGLDPGQFANFETRVRYLQPMDGPRRTENTRAAIEYCLTHPSWRLSIQTHKEIGLP